jgi:predicted glycoside hydrolase/deacetylase ChbG (UPF0249 family)
MNCTPATRYLIVNADDFGLSPGVNRGILQAHEEGVVTSASLMVRGPAAEAAAAYAREHPRLSVGLHVDLGEWLYAHGSWRAAYEVVPLTEVAAVAAEVNRQLLAFRNLVGRAPSHLDSHQHVHRAEPVRSVMLEHARRLGVVLRSCDSQVRYCGDFYGQSDKGYSYPEGISVEALLGILRRLPPGTTEVGCHPGTGADVNSVYCQERAVECRTLCDPQVRSAITSEGIVLCSFADQPDTRADSAAHGRSIGGAPAPRDR